MLQFYRIIGEQADYMRDLLGDLLDVARIETGELSVAPAPADVASLVDEARSRFQSGGGRNNLRIDLSPDLPLVMADREARRPGAEQPALQRGQALPERGCPPSGCPPCGRATTWRSRSPTRAVG